MNKKDLERFARVEKQISEQSDTHKLSQLPDFPYKTLDELKTAHRNKDIVLGSDYSGDFLQVIGTTADNVIHMFWISLPIIIIIIDIVLAIMLKKWILLWGILFASIGFFSSSPYNALKKPISGLGTIFFISSFFFLDWTWSVLIGSMLFSQIFAMTAREQYRSVVEERALQSEIFFCYMLKTKHLLVKDTKTNKVYQPSEG
ncbi:hypothetical protein [Agriterribacter humi]|uniref:hypothetical protein n=1 Tax=Agriterribacter humi TaxID=1104781 RepID=UPI001263EE93|nr:hypothetical protein [Agriterribacter humi]